MLGDDDLPGTETTHSSDVGGANSASNVSTPNCSSWDIVVGHCRWSTPSAYGDEADTCTRSDGDAAPVELCNPPGLYEIGS
ncbi:hypothetical protein O3P69_003631 [Scylla paramamosain]|uniref:Uncharacterized protein n=1 Tax=Scylla paramamosain TaxID=85552 RepID=A0AAW0UNJ2_SCYPA